MNVVRLEHFIQTKCDTCAVHNRSICGAASGQALLELEKLSRTRCVTAGQTIVNEKSEVEFVGNVVTGVMKLSKTLEDGRQQVVGLLFPTDFFGPIHEDVSQFSLEAASNVELCVFERHAFEALISRHPELEHEILMRVLTDLDATREWLVLLGSQSSREKIAGFLLMLLRRASHRGCARSGHDLNQVVAFPISRNDIAMYLATTLETISRQLNWLARTDVIRIIDNKHFEIIRPRQLAEIASKEEWLKDFPT